VKIYKEKAYKEKANKEKVVLFDYLITFQWYQQRAAKVNHDENPKKAMIVQIDCHYVNCSISKLLFPF